MKKYPLTITLFFAHIANADVPPETQHEVQHLINFVTSTQCQIVRNGTSHNGAEAIEHIKKKYKYYSDDIRTAEQFIEYSATKSTLSGKYYLVKCGSNSPVKTRDWLLHELKKYRVKRSI